MADDTRELPNLFKKSNLIFTTKDPGRKPTFYFDDRTSTGRLRTDHSNGPQKYEDANRRTHYFFAQKSDRDSFYNNVRGGQKVSDQGGPYTTRTAGYYHCEFEIDNDKQITGSNCHRSGGTLVLNASSFSDSDLKKIYNRVMDKSESSDTSAISWSGLPNV